MNAPKSVCRRRSVSMNPDHRSKPPKSFYRSAIVRFCASLLATLSVTAAAEAAPCGQQSVLNATSALGAASVAGVRRDQQELLAVATQSAEALRFSGIDEKVVQKFLNQLQLSVPVYCLPVPNAQANRRGVASKKKCRHRGRPPGCRTIHQGDEKTLPQTAEHLL